MTNGDRGRDQCRGRESKQSTTGTEARLKETGAVPIDSEIVREGQEVKERSVKLIATSGGHLTSQRVLSNVLWYSLMSARFSREPYTKTGVVSNHIRFPFYNLKIRSLPINNFTNIQNNYFFKSLHSDSHYSMMNSSNIEQNMRREPLWPCKGLS